MNAKILIAGGGLAAQRCCETLRRSGHVGPITIVCAEDAAPYDRPPLSKQVLAGSMDGAELSLRPAGWHAERDVELRLGRAAAELRADAHELVLDDATTLGYDRLLIATGARPRQLPLLAGAPNVHVLRTMADAAALRAVLSPGARLVVVGGGFIGQEVAATARGLGVDVSLLEALDAPLVNLLGHELGTWFAGLHRRHGVDVHCGAAAVEAHQEPDGSVSSLMLGEGRSIGCDVIVVGVGVAPADEWLAGSGIGGGGVECDVEGRTALDDVFAAGDVARPYDHYLGTHARSEHWEAAARQGAAAARAMLGLPAPASPPASFWSEQYGLRIQYLGYAPLGDRVEVDGEPADDDFRVLWLREDRPVAALLVGRPRELPSMRKLIQQTLDEHTQEISS